MKDIKAFEDAVASARVHITNCGPVGDNEEDCFTCRGSRALVEAHIALERYKMAGHFLTRCDLGHVFIDKYRVNGECPFCDQLMNRESYIEWLRRKIFNLGIQSENKIMGVCENILDEPRAKLAQTLIPALHKAFKNLKDVHDRMSDPALKKLVFNDIIEPLMTAASSNPYQEKRS